ncbi:MAG: 3'-5' exonuclease [Alphaproteobacteria bacterium]
MTVLRVIDFETTGMEPPAVVVEVGICDLTQMADGSWCVEEQDSWLCGGVDVMPPEVRAVHHISLLDLDGLEPFNRTDIFSGALPSALVSHNMDFEAKFLGPHGLPEICTLKAALRVWPQAPGHSNQVLRYWLEDQGLLSLDDVDAMPPHRAGPDAYVTAHILKALFAAGATGRDMVTWTKEPRLLPTCPIGKFRGKPWAEVEGGFLSWMLKQPDMDADLKWNASRELDRRSAL